MVVGTKFAKSVVEKIKPADKQSVEDKIKDNRLEAASLILRIGLGFVFIITGITKLLATENFAQVVQDLALVPFSATLFTYLLAMLELAVGILLFIGFLTRVVAVFTAALLAIFLIVVMLFIDKSPVNIGLIAVAVVIAILGPGNLAVDNLLKRQE